MCRKANKYTPKRLQGQAYWLRPRYSITIKKAHQMAKDLLVRFG